MATTRLRKIWSGRHDTEAIRALDWDTGVVKAIIIIATDLAMSTCISVDTLVGTRDTRTTNEGISCSALIRGDTTTAGERILRNV